MRRLRNPGISREPCVTATISIGPLWRPVNDEVCADRPEENGKPGEVFTFMTHARILSERFKRFEKFGDPAVRSVDAVPGDVIPNGFQVENGIVAEDVPAPTPYFRRASDFRLSLARASAGLKWRLWSSESRRRPSS